MRLAVPRTELTDAAQTQTEIRELDRRTASVTANLGGLSGRGKHQWSGTHTKTSGGGFVAMTNFPTETRNAGLVTMDTAGNFLLGVSGDWSLTFGMYSSAASAGIQWMMIWWASPNPIAPMEIVDARHRASGYTGAGELYSTLTWTGHVPQEFLLSPIQFRVSWGSATGVDASLTYHVSLEYLGTPPSVPTNGGTS